MAARHRKCPTPAKVKYTAMESALAAVRATPKAGLRPYKCRSHWHTTSSPRWKR